MSSEDALLIWGALSNEPPDADFATLDTILTTSTDEPDDLVPVLDFDPGATQEYAVFSGVMPAQYAGGGLKLELMWTAEGTSGAVKWDAAFKRLQTGAPLLSSVYDDRQSTISSVSSVARNINRTIINFADRSVTDAIVAGDRFHLLITRDSGDAADTMDSNDAELIAAYLTEA